MYTAVSYLGHVSFFKLFLLYKSHFPTQDLDCQHSDYSTGSLLTLTAGTHKHHTNHTPPPECYTDSTHSHCSNKLNTHTRANTRKDTQTRANTLDLFALSLKSFDRGNAVFL